MDIIFHGKPGSGKGTQADLIVKEQNIIHISTGDIFRKNIQQKTQLGQMASTYMDQGKLVPDKLTIDLLSSELDTHSNPTGFIFDGFPRTLPQAKAFDELLKSRNTPLSMVISLEVKEQELIKRLLHRGIDSGREDDQDENIIRNRINIYHQQTSVLKQYYLDKINNAFYSIDGEKSIVVIFNDISSIILQHKKNV